MQTEIRTINSEQGIALSACNPGYQLDTREADIPSMVSEAQFRLPILRRRAVFVAVGSEAWQAEYPSLKDFRFLKRQYKRYSRAAGEAVEVFDPMTGAVNVPVDELTASPLGGFFTALRTRNQGGFTQLRGLTYNVSLDYSKNTPDKKLEVIKRDVQEGLDVISLTDREQLTAMDYLLYLGILDHLKAHTLTTFHALTFHERTGAIPDDGDYQRIRKEAQRLMFTVTRAYYQAILGQPFDAGFNRAEVQDTLERIGDYIVSNGHSAEHFTYREVDNPIIIMLGAHEAARKQPLPDLIIGIPSGGTEVAIATHLMYENLYPAVTSPDMAFVPLSFHYRAQGGVTNDKLAEILKQTTKIRGRHVLVVDDNSNTGSTLQTMATAACAAGASSVAAHIAEIDPSRVIAKSIKENGLPFGVVNMDHPDLQTAMGISWTSDKDGDDLRRKKVTAFVRMAHRRVEKKSCAF